ncbi:hypothetical protein R1sor_011040 [Riccia sorocarpa]|uniref:Uncharacterized protein n=1 Tax=Riccia sorocarpa TaxID=122646 RepID=A0ABD3I5T4_9MARC
MHHLWTLGHRGLIHDTYAQAGNKRKEREEEVTPALAAIRADPIIHLLEKSDRRESWRCDQCSAKGSGYMSCKNHIDSERHQKVLSAYIKPPPVQGQTPATDTIEPDAPKEKLHNTASSSAQATLPANSKEPRQHSTARKLQWEDSEVNA